MLSVTAPGGFADWTSSFPGWLRLGVALGMLAITLALGGRRVVRLVAIIRSGTAAPGRLGGAGQRARDQLSEVFGQARLLKWTKPGLAHFFTFWGFLVLGITIIEAYGALTVSADFAFPLFGHARWLGFLEDLFAVLVLAAIGWFAVNRHRSAPSRLHRSSRFYGSHNRAAGVILWMILAVIVTLLVYRGAQYNTGHFPWGHSAWPFASWLVAHALGSGSYDQGVETVFLIAQMAVIFTFLLVVLHSKHLHIFLAPLNVLTKREPDAMRELLPITDRVGSPIDFTDLDNVSEDAVFGRGKIEDFTWKAYLDFFTCTECGRCQSQCPAWNTGKPLSPKLLIMDLRDHLAAKAPYILDAKPVAQTASAHGVLDPDHVPESGYPRVPGSGPAQAVRPLVGDLDSGGVIDPDVLWACTTCGACVEECPVDIEHVDHIVDMRRSQVLNEAAFPPEAATMLRNIENLGNPWGLANSARDDWMAQLPFEVRRAEPGMPLAPDIEYLFWAGCAAALDDRAKRVTVAFVELLHAAGVEFAVLGQRESCTGDPARRLGNEFLFQTQAAQNIEMLDSVSRDEPLKIVVTCPHCFNAIANEYRQLGSRYEVVHHTELLQRLIDDGRLAPIAEVDKLITYHDPCYLGRHNKIYMPPRTLLAAIPSLRSDEMPRCKDHGFCCGGGGARFWMEERIGKRMNRERTDEAIGLDPDVIGTACPFCMVMLSDGLAEKKGDGTAKDHVQVLDVAQVLRESVLGTASPDRSTTSPYAGPKVGAGSDVHGPRPEEGEESDRQ